jgi:fumarate reductase subunit C
LIQAVSQGESSYRTFLSWSTCPGILVLNLITLFFVVFHASTWFNLAPKAMVVHWQGKRVPALWIAASNYAAWVVVSVLVAWLLLGA